VSFAVQVILARSLGPSAFGIYLVALAAMNVAVLPAKTEMDSAALRYVAAYLADERWDLLRGFVHASRRWVLGLSIAVATIGLLIILWLGLSRVSGVVEARRPLVLACLLLFPTVFLITNSAILQALGWYTKAQLPQQLIRPLAFGLLLIALPSVVARPLTPDWALGANLVASLLALAVAERWLRSALPAELGYSRPEYATTDWWKTGLALLSIAVAQLAMSPSVDLLLVGTLRGPTASGLYGAATQVAGLVDFGWNAVFFVTAPTISATFAGGGAAQLQELLRSINRTNLLLCLPLAAVAIVAGGVLLRLYGSVFLLALPVLVILVLGQVVAGIIGAAAGYVMTMTEHQRPAAIILAVLALGSIAVRLSLTAKYGIVGTAFGALLTATGRSLILAAYIRREMKINVLRF
jgi:O-antigen/teichoic acid export membrane protein